MSGRALPVVGGMLALAAGILSFTGHTTAEPIDELDALDGAIAFFEQRVQERPDDFIAAHQLATRYLARFGANGDLHEVHRAEHIMRKALETLPTYGPAHALLVKVHIARHEFPEALHAAEHAWEYHPRTATNGVVFDANFEMARYDSAEAALNRLDPRSFAYLTRAARLAERMGADAEAERFMERACRPDAVSSDRLRAWCAVRLGELDHAAGRTRQAAAKFQSAIDLIPGYTASHIRLGDLSLEQGNLEQAAQHYEVARMRTVGAEALLRLADIADLAGNADQAREYRHEFLDRVRDPLYGRAFWLPAAEALARLGMTDSAVALVRADVDQRPGVESYTGLATVAQIVGDTNLLKLAADSLR